MDTSRFTPKQLTLIIGGIIGVLVIGLIIYALIPRATLVFAVAPQEVTVTLNGKEQSVENGSRVTVGPGTIEMTISRDGFESYSETLTVKNGDETELLVALNPLTAEARALLDNPASQAIIERIGAREVNRGSAALLERYPILAELPINDRFYTVVPCNSVENAADATAIAICIRLFDMQAEQSALDDLTNRGYVLSEYEIIIEDYTFETLREAAGE